MPVSNNIYYVTYQVHLPDPNAATDGTADVYRRPSVECLVLAAAQDNATLLAVINGNVTLQPGEVIDILQVENMDLGNRLVFQ